MQFLRPIAQHRAFSGSTATEDWAALKSVLPDWAYFVEMPINHGTLEQGYGGMHEPYLDAAKYAFTNDITMVFAPPDTLFSDGSWTFACEALQKGYRAVVLPRLRVVKGTFPCQTTIYRFRTHEGGDAALAPLTKAFFTDAADFTTWPSNVLHHHSGGRIVQACHVPPLMARLQRLEPYSNIDYDFLGVCVDRDRIWFPSGVNIMVQVDRYHFHSKPPQYLEAEGRSDAFETVAAA